MVPPTIINAMVTSGQMPTYFTADTIMYSCISGYSPQNAMEVSCICDVSNTDDWSCTIDITDFENECWKG